MNAAEKATAEVIKSSLKDSPAFREVDERLFVIKQGSAYVMINVVAWGEDRAMVRCVSQLVKGVELNHELAVQLMELNAQLRFGAFAYDSANKLILFIHSILGGATLDRAELTATVSDVALIADEYDDKIANRHGGQRMRDLIEESAVTQILDADPSAFDFGARA